MARTTNRDIARVLADVANVFLDDPNQTPPLAGVRVGLIITEWLEERGDNMSQLYDDMLHIPRLP